KEPRDDLLSDLAARHVDDIRARLAALVAAGAEVLQTVQDVGGGRLIASAKDADGNLIGLLQDA
ncbi:VOC family protein, partial [Streptomyces sp. NPDC056159]|uniref:VOC family protein n=1 Tax=Streptomyces sp. NPDC056159 TaxID=3155537 RepID=UPI0034488034